MADAAAAAESRADGPTPDSAADDFEFCILSSGGIVPAGGKGAGTADMCVADELFCQGKLLPLRPSSAAAADGASVATLPRSESAASTVGLGSRSGSRSASSSGSSSGCVSRSQSSKSASSDQGGGCGPTAAALPPRRSLSSSVFYAHPSPSPQLRSARPRRSTGSAAQPPAAVWGLFRLGVVGVPDVYPPPRPAADAKAAARGGGSRCARFEQAAAAADDRKLGLAALFGDSLGCRCSPDAIEPVRKLEAAKRAGRKKDGAKSGGPRVARRSRILDWLDELSIVKEKE